MHTSQIISRVFANTLSQTAYQFLAPRIKYWCSHGIQVDSWVIATVLSLHSLLVNHKSFSRYISLHYPCNASNFCTYPKASFINLQREHVSTTSVSTPFRGRLLEGFRDLSIQGWGCCSRSYYTHLLFLLLGSVSQSIQLEGDKVIISCSLGSCSILHIIPSPFPFR